jgi:hypothetical protein
MRQKILPASDSKNLENEVDKQDKQVQSQQIESQTMPDLMKALKSTAQ